MDVTTDSGTPARPVIRKITTNDVYAALADGWADFKAAPRFGLFFGGVYAIAGMIILLQLMVWEQPLWIVPLVFAFPLIGPFAAVGLYEVSRRREAGEALDWAEKLDASDYSGPKLWDGAAAERVINVISDFFKTSGG